MKLPVNDNGDVTSLHVRLDAPWTLLKLKLWAQQGIELSGLLSGGEEPHAEIHRRHVRRLKALQRALNAVPPDFDPEQENGK